MTTLHDRLDDLAGEAPAAPSVYAGDLWARGKRRHRRRVAGAVVAAAAVVAVAVAVPVQLGERHAVPRPAAPVPVSELHLPDRIHKPHPWSDGTGESGEIGPLAAIGEAPRLLPRGWTEAVESYALFGVSAVDGTVRFLDLPVDDAVEEPPWGGSTVALSPDGHLVAFEVRKRERAAADGAVATGWRVYDTVTGTWTDLRDPGRAEFSSTLNDLVFTADSRYLVTSYDFAGRPGANRRHGLVAWDVETGERFVLENPGRYWLPGVGTAPHGLLVDRKFTVRHVDPRAGEVERFRLPKAVVSASIGPDGEALAYVGGDWTPGPDGGINARTWRVHAGPDRENLRQVELPQGDFTNLILGWRDATHVIINGWSEDYAEIDVTTGSVRTFAIPGSGGGPATLAHDLWVNDLVPGVEPPSASDPRSRWWRAGGAALVVLAVAGIVLWRRRGRA